MRDYYTKGNWESRSSVLYQREQKAFELLRFVLRAGDAVLDAGCGEGAFLKVLSNDFTEVNLYGAEFSTFQLKKAKRLPFTFKRADLNKQIPFDDEIFRVVYAGELIEHLYDPDKFLEEARRVLEPGGFLVISTPNLCCWFNRLIFPLGIQPLFVETSSRSKMVGSGPLRRFKREATPVGHLRIFNKTALCDILRESGFEVIQIKGAVFDSGFPSWLLVIDRLFNVVPALASEFVVLARKE